LQDPPKITRIWIFGLKIYHLATLGGKEWLQLMQHFRFPENEGRQSKPKKVSNRHHLNSKFEAERVLGMEVLELLRTIMLSI
jgi:hypothetical protein